MAVVSELVTKFSFIGSLTPQKEFNANLKLSIGLLAGAAAGMAAAAGGIFAFVSSNTQAADALVDFNAETGIAVERVQELGFAASMSGSSQEAMTASLAALSKSAGDASRGLGRGRKAFEELGISVTDAAGNVKTADVLFNELRESFARLGTSAGAQKSIIASLGLDPSTLQLLNATSEEVDLLVEKSRQLGIVTTEQAEAAAEFQDALGMAQFGVSALGQQVAISLAPAMQRVTERFIDFLIANKDLIRDGLTYLGEVIISVTGFVERMAPVILIAAAAFAAWQLATGGLVAILGVLLSPVVLITAAIVALLLIIDDLIVAFNGGQSVIRDFFMEFFGFDIVPVLHGIVDAFNAMIGELLGIIEPFVAIWGELFSAVILAFQGDFEGALDALGNAFMMWIDLVKGAFGAMFDWLGTMWGGILEGIRAGAMSILPDWAVEMIGSGESPEDISGMTPNDAMAIGGGSTSTTNNSSIEQQNQIIVHSSDPDQAGAAVNDALQEQLRNAKTQVSRGGR